MVVRRLLSSTIVMIPEVFWTKRGIHIVWRRGDWWNKAKQVICREINTIPRSTTNVSAQSKHLAKLEMCYEIRWGIFPVEVLI